MDWIKKEVENAENAESCEEIQIDLEIKMEPLIKSELKVNKIL